MKCDLWNRKRKRAKKKKKKKSELNQTLVQLKSQRQKVDGLDFESPKVLITLAFWAIIFGQLILDDWQVPSR